MSFLLATMIAVLLVTGLGAALLGSIKLPLAARLKIDEARVGGLVSLFGFIMIPVIPTAGFLTDHFGGQFVLMSGSLLLALSLFVLAAARTYPLALIAVLLLSAGWSLMVNVGNVLTPHAFPGETLSTKTNLANVLFGLGALLTPMALAALVRRASLPTALALAGALALAPAGLALGVDFGPIFPPAASDAAVGGLSVGSLLEDRILWLCGLALFCYGPLEASMGAWCTTYLGERGVRPETAASLLSGFWLAFMVSRLATAFTLSAGGETKLILGLAVLCVLVLTAVVRSRRAATAMLCVLAAGLVFGPIFPTLMAVLLGHFPQSAHGRVVGLLFGIGGIGWTVIPILIGAYARRTSVQRGFSIAAAAAVALCVVALGLAAAQPLKAPDAAGETSAAPLGDG
jgi:fucose permease